MERIGKVFKKKVQEIGQFRMVSGYVRSKKLKNVVNSIDFLDCVTEKLGTETEAETAIGWLKEKREDVGRLLNIEEVDGMTFFEYTFRQEGDGGTGKTVENRKSEEIASGQAEKPALVVSTEKTKSERKARMLINSVEAFLRRQKIWVEATMRIYCPEMASAVYGVA